MVHITSFLLIIFAVLLFGLIIFLHELGHFLTAKSMGVKVNEFALGMGPAIFKFKKGDTLYALRVLPIGGYCAMEGEDEESSDEAAFGNKAVWKRILIVVAGAVMNIILGFVLMIILLVQSNYYASTTIAKFADNSTSHAAGLEVGDKIISINGYKIYTDKDLAFALSTDKDFTVDMVVLRDGNFTNVENVKFPIVTDESGKEMISMDFFVMPIERTFGSLLSQSFKTTVSMVRMVWSGLIGLITGQFGFSDVTGPVGAASAITDAASAGLQQNFVQALNNIILMMIIITVNLGIVNLLPLPALDGGRLVFLVIEGIRGKPINPKYEGFIHAAGFVFLLILMAVITFSDILRISTGKGLGG